MADDPIKSEKPRFHIAFLQAIKAAILRRPLIKFGAGFLVTESDGEILVSLAGASQPKKEN